MLKAERYPKQWISVEPPKLVLKMLHKIPPVVITKETLAYTFRELKDRWAQLTQAKVREQNAIFDRTFQDEKNSYRFSVNHIEPFGYRTMPVIIDYRLFADITTESSSKPIERAQNVLLGSFFDDTQRRSRPFGNDYFEATYKELISIVGAEFTSKERYQFEEGQLSLF